MVLMVFRTIYTPFLSKHAVSGIPTFCIQSGRLQIHLPEVASSVSDHVARPNANWKRGWPSPVVIVAVAASEMEICEGLWNGNMALGEGKMWQTSIVRYCSAVTVRERERERERERRGRGGDFLFRSFCLKIAKIDYENVGKKCSLFNYCC